MTIEEMHYDFKQKLNKIDSQKYRNLIIPEIDWQLNEAQQIFIKSIAQPRFRNGLGFEVNQRSIDDIRTVVKENISISTTPFGDNKTYTMAYPADYWFMSSSSATATKNNCTVELKTNEREHNDQFEDSYFDNSNFEWRETNYVYYNNGVRFFTDGTFTISKVTINYISLPPFIHYAQGVNSGGGYTTPAGVALTGKMNCPLPVGTHSEIVDIAVLIAAGNLNMPNYQLKMAKLKLND